VDQKDLIIQTLLQKIDELQKKLALLEEKISTYEKPKNSSNSSIPPARDENRKNRSLREKSDKKSGGQKGHKGSTLEMVSVPDLVIVHQPDYCQDCGKNISSSEAVFEEKRQVVDLPVIRPIYTEHQCFSKACSCGKTNYSKFPSSVKATIQYGPQIESTVAYLSVRQYLPYKRICEYLKDGFNVNISQGSIANLLERFSSKADLPYQVIKSNIERCQVIGADETGVKINGVKAWIHTWQDELNTFIAVSNHRGSKAIKDNFPLGFPQATLVSDAWAAQLATPAKAHQLCLAHLLRDLNYFIDTFKSDWASQVKKVLKEAIELKSSLTENDYEGIIKQRDDLRERFDQLLEENNRPSIKKIRAFYKRLAKNRGNIFNFLYNHHIPPDNNASERAIRNSKVKQKISGQFKTMQGAEIFVTIRSIIDTGIKRGSNVFDALFATANFSPE